MDFFTSDTHFYHDNIIKYCSRPFANVEKMNEELANNINSKVRANDTLYHLGDFCFGGKDKPKKAREMINCKNIILILGNHDKPKDKDFLSLFSNTYPIYEYRGNNKRIVLCHYAMKVWNLSGHGSFHLYGHSHKTLPDDKHSLSFDVGVDCHNYQPLSFEDVIDIMLKKDYIPVDHHGPHTT